METPRSTQPTHPKRNRAFTLIELSIVLVIIGLIVGGVLVGRDLIRAAEVRAQISQIEKFQTATNTFRGKYGYLPGDIIVTAATQFGFVPGNLCDGTQGKRDGNGLIQAWASPWHKIQFIGETGFFWQDLGTAGLVEGKFNGIAVHECYNEPHTPITLSAGTYSVRNFIPQGKIGDNLFVYAYENNGSNWFGLSKVNGTSPSNGWSILSTPNIAVSTAYAIDAKIDNGLANTGTVQALYLDTPGAADVPSTVNAAANATSDNSATCYNTTSGAYSLSQNNGNGVNCALSFKLQ